MGGGAFDRRRPAKVELYQQPRCLARDDGEEEGAAPAGCSESAPSQRSKRAAGADVHGEAVLRNALESSALGKCFDLHT